MTRDEAKQLLPIIAAFADGKQIQIRQGTEWINLTSPEFPFSADRYRIKPEPREWTMIFNGDGTAIVDIAGLAAPRRETIRVREILD